MCLTPENSLFDQVWSCDITNPAPVGLRVSDGGPGLVQPLRAGLGTVGHSRRTVLPGRARGGAGDRAAGDFQYRPGAQFTSDAFTALLRTAGVQISMDGRGRALDNVFVERLWRSVKYEEVYLKDYDSVPAARAGLGDYFAFYNHERPHQALAYRTPAEVYGEVPAVVLASAPSGC